MRKTLEFSPIGKWGNTYIGEVEVESTIETWQLRLGMKQK